MPATQFDRDALADWYARQHLATDPGVVEIYYLPKNSGEREIRFLEVNQMIGDRNDSSLEPIDFGIDAGTETEHRLVVIDVTPDQWKRIQSKELLLPQSWTLDQQVRYIPTS